MSPDEHYLSQDLLNFGALSSFSGIVIDYLVLNPHPHSSPPRSSKNSAIPIRKEVHRYYDYEGEVFH